MMHQNISKRQVYQCIDVAIFVKVFVIIAGKTGPDSVMIENHAGDSIESKSVELEFFQQVA